jgi:lipid II:glycine glycyltransferase (peptidoglycan interpeptide bridge formation enzyme)
MIEIAKDLNEFDEFVSNHKFGNVMQLSNWGEVKRGDWDPNYILMRDCNGDICASALLLTRKFKFYKLMYSPRGYVIDWNNEALVQKFHNLVKEFAKKHKIDTLKIDPSIYVNMSTQDEDELNNHRITMDKLGFKRVNEEESIQLSNQMYIDLQSDSDKIKQNFSKNIKRYLNKVVKNNEFVPESQSNAEHVKKFAQLIKYTEEKHNIFLRNEEYYLKILEKFKADNVDVHLMKINIDKIISNLENPSQVEVIKKAYEQIHYSNGIFVVYGCDTAEMYYGASNPVFNNYRPTYYTHYLGMLKAKEKGYKYFNLGGVHQTSDNDGLYQFKRKLGAINMRFIGEYDYHIKSNIKAKAFNLLKKVYKKVRK